MFGTFQAEEEKPTYGITKPINSWNAVYANISHYEEMGKDIKRIPKWKDKILYLFMKPGWLPDYMGGYRPAPAVDKSVYKKYDTPAPVLLNLYVLFQYVLCLTGTALFLFKAGQFSLLEKSVFAVLISVVVVNCGVLFEQKPWVKWSEWLRIILYPAILVVLSYQNNWPLWTYLLAVAYFAISAYWFYSILKKQERVQVA
jgi:hypothetical protein